MPWQSTGAGTLQFRRWPDQWLVFHPLSGATHLLSEAAGLVLEALDRQTGALDIDAVLRLLLADELADDEERATVQAALDSFVELGLAEEVSA